MGCSLIRLDIRSIGLFLSLLLKRNVKVEIWPRGKSRINFCKNPIKLVVKCLSASIVYHTVCKIEIVFLLYLSMKFRTRLDRLFLFFRETVIISVVTIFQHLFSSTCVRVPTNNVQSVHFKVPLYNNISLCATRKQFRYYIIYNLIYLRACIAVLTFTCCTCPC